MRDTMSYADRAMRGELNEQEIDSLYAEHHRLGHTDDDHAGECYGCFAIDEIANANERAKNAQK